ncbi:HipA-like C-terminal domain-containing protein [Marinospirillum celere]|uniref:HipA-like C-terminal domain-containing protein n=1 Tax=Marinospirillum celere TaxID=1122252 RepID=A0A1I1FCE2_9GAMM|nr:hypothetical protein [Marinospirillum celere]SFB97057.1 HipA-like C-terminal domain-containing protein [Marinospirillum celere]
MTSLSLLELTLHGHKVGHLAGYKNGKNLLLFSPEFIQDKARPTYWSLIYQDHFTPRLAPAYDILCTQAFMANEQTLALNLAKNKHWYRISLESFEAWAKKADIPWRLIQPHLKSTLEKAKTLWPKALDELPMQKQQKETLIKHWKNLHPDFRLLNK